METDDGTVQFLAGGYVGTPRVMVCAVHAAEGKRGNVEGAKKHVIPTQIRTS